MTDIPNKGLLAKRRLVDFWFATFCSYKEIGVVRFNTTGSSTNIHIALVIDLIKDMPNSKMGIPTTDLRGAYSACQRWPGLAVSPDDRKRVGETTPGELET